MLWRCIDINATLYKRYVPAGKIMCLILHLNRSDKEQLNSTELDKLCPQGEAGPLLIQCKDDKGEFLSGIATNNAGVCWYGDWFSN